MMELLLSVDWIALFVLTAALLLFMLLYWLRYKINWTMVILLSLVCGAVIGIVFASDDNGHLVWLALIGNIYVKAITALVVPVIMVSILSGFISLGDKEKMKSIGLMSVFWLLVSAAAAIALSLFFGLVLGIGKNAGVIFADIASVSNSTVDAYDGMTSSFREVLQGLFPSNIVSDIADNNIIAIIIIAVVLAAACVGISADEESEAVAVFVQFIEGFKKILFRILSYIIDMTPYGVLCLVAVSVSSVFANRAAVLQLILLVALIYFVCLLHCYGFNAILLKVYARLTPAGFFQMIFQAQATAFTTSSSMATLPVSINALETDVGVDSEVANFTAPLGTTIGMPGCTCVWPILLAVFYINASGRNWSVGDYLILAFLTLLLSLGSAGVPGIAVVSAVAVFSAVNLPIAAVVLLMPINTISDMVRTLNNVTAANVSAAIVARRTGLLDDTIFNSGIQKNKKTKKTPE